MGGDYEYHLGCIIIWDVINKKPINCLWDPKTRYFYEMFKFKWFYKIRQVLRLTYKSNALRKNI